MLVVDPNNPKLSQAFGHPYHKGTAASSLSAIGNGVLATITRCG
jgi:hypothetical protein